MGRLNDSWSYMTSVLRGGRGLRVLVRPSRLPEAPLELYEFEPCPFCRKVREVLSEMDLSYVVRPCPRGSTRNRAKVLELGGRAMFPFLVDPNTGRSLYESEDIIAYLMVTYGPGKRAGLGPALAPVNTLTSFVASVFRPKGGDRGRSAVAEGPVEPLELWGFEASPYVRKVRELLCELELDHWMHNVAKTGRRRPELVALGGKMQVPYLADPNTGAALYESDAIVAYLRRTYGA